MGSAATAFAYDRHPEVRMRAVFVVTARAGVEEGEATLMAALDDQVFAGDAARLGQLGLALENLVHCGATNAVDRVGRRLLANGALSESTRQAVTALLERALPGHDDDHATRAAPPPGHGDDGVR